MVKSYTERDILNISLNTKFNLSKTDDHLNDLNHYRILFETGNFLIRKKKNNGFVFYEVFRIIDKVRNILDFGSIANHSTILFRTKKKPIQILNILKKFCFTYKEYVFADSTLIEYENGLSFIIERDPEFDGWVLNSKDVPLYEGEELSSFYERTGAENYARNYMKLLYYPDKEYKKIR